MTNTVVTLTVTGGQAAGKTRTVNLLVRAMEREGYVVTCKGEATVLKKKGSPTVLFEEKNI